MYIQLDAAPLQAHSTPYSVELIKNSRDGKPSPQGFDETFQFWWSHWQNTLNELNAGPLFSDPFLRQDFHVVMRHLNQVIGSVSFRFLTPFAADCWAKDSALQSWPIETLSVFLPMKVLLASWLIVHPDYRSVEINGERISTRMLRLLPWALDQVGADVCLGTPRDDRRMNEKMKNLGALELGQSEMFGVPVHLMAFVSEAADSKFILATKENV